MLRQISSLFLNHMLQHALGLAGAILAARLLGVELRGVVVVVVVAATIGMTVAQLGLPQALNYHLSRAGDRREALGQALAVCLRLLPWIVLVAAVFFGVAAWAGRTTLLSGLSPGLIVAAFVYTLAMTGHEVVMRLLLGLHDYRMRNIVNVMQPALSTAFLVLFWICGWTLQPLYLAAAYAGFTLLSLCVGVWAIRRSYAPALGPLPADWKREYVGYGLRFYPSLLVNMLNYRVDAILVNAILGSAAVGLYATGTSMSEMLLFLPNTVNFVFFNHVSRAPESERRRLTARTLGFSLYIVGASGIVLAFLLPTLIPWLFGVDFAPAVPAAMWLLPGMAALTVVKILSHAVAGCGKPEYATYATVVGLVGILALDIWLIPTHGIVGAAWASWAGYSLWAIAVVALYLRIVRVGPFRFALDVISEPAYWLLTRVKIPAPRQADELVELEVG
jgi:O-antigen/teichoic acid export membrane protein